MSGDALLHYYRILDGDEQAKYLKAKDVAVDIDLESETKILMRAHDSAMSSTRSSQMKDHIPSLLDVKAELAKRMLGQCELCERRCKANRSAGMKGHCGVLEPRISSDFLHLGEEPDLVPSYTIFFSGCTFNCVFCQNWDISTRPGSGVEMSPESVARKIESRFKADRGTLGLSRARNVNWVGGEPTSNLPFILEVFKKCTANLPQVWNSNMYLTEESMRLLNGVIDVYLTDFKYGNDACALRLSNAPDYMRVVKRNHVLARDQAEVIIRHLVLPGHIECCTRPVLNWISENLRCVKVNVMAQYRPEHRAREFPEIARSLRMSEFKKALEIAYSLGLELDSSSRTS